ncbi:hypothetical protein [Atlantibacter hermannii]|uniref:hypothetical protein n=1 Tax=Atlantibacter hermannii TaxID=565 RepID=UPI00332DFDED
MTLRFRRALRTINCRDYFRDEKRWMVWWYCGFKANKRTSNYYQPMVNTAFVEVLDNGQLARTKRFIPIPVSEISLFSLGTVWQNGICILERVLEERTFELDYSPDGWDFTSFRERYPGGPYPHELYPYYDKDKNWMLEFCLQKGGTLVVPCQEFFSRCYGFSGEIKRVLTTYPWDECLVRFFGDNRGKTTGPVTVGNFVTALPGQVFSFKHSTTKNMHHPGIPAVRNALSKVGITAFRNGSWTVEPEL